jgi:hypothetical protein
MARRREVPIERDLATLPNGTVDVPIPPRLQFGPQWFHKSTAGLPDSVREGEALRRCAEVQQAYVECKRGQRPTSDWCKLQILYPMSAEELGIAPVSRLAFQGRPD